MKRLVPCIVLLLTTCAGAPTPCPETELNPLTGMTLQCEEEAGTKRCLVLDPTCGDTANCVRGFLFMLPPVAVPTDPSDR